MTISHVMSLYEEIDAEICNKKLKEGDHWTYLLERAKAFYSAAMEVGDESLSNKAWFILTSCEVIEGYVNAFLAIKNGIYYKSWCLLERIEIGVESLKRNQFIEMHRYGVDFIEKHTHSLQKLFPYKVFFSPEFLHKRVECSICGEVQNPWSNCTHEAGRVYGGRECIHIVKGVEILGIAMVSKPVQKYSVAITHGDDGEPIDHYDYTVVKFVMDRLQSPFHSWEAEWTLAYHPHELYSELSKADPCPCGSGRIYNDCCMKKDGVVRPHLDVHFTVDPPADLPCIQFSGYK